MKALTAEFMEYETEKFENDVNKRKAYPKGRMHTESGESFTTWNEASSLRVNDVVEEFGVTNAFVEMVENVSRVIEGQEGWIVPSADSIRVAQILDNIARHP